MDREEDAINDRPLNLEKRNETSANEPRRTSSRGAHSRSNRNNPYAGGPVTAVSPATSVNTTSPMMTSAGSGAHVDSESLLTANPEDTTEIVSLFTTFDPDAVSAGGSGGNQSHPMHGGGGGYGNANQPTSQVYHHHHNHHVGHNSAGSLQYPQQRTGSITADSFQGQSSGGAHGQSTGLGGSWTHNPYASGSLPPQLSHQHSSGLLHSVDYCANNSSGQLFSYESNPYMQSGGGLLPGHHHINNMSRNNGNSNSTSQNPLMFNFNASNAALGGEGDPLGDARRTSVLMSSQGNLNSGSGSGATGLGASQGDVRIITREIHEDGNITVSVKQKVRTDRGANSLGSSFAAARSQSDSQLMPVPPSPRSVASHTSVNAALTFDLYGNGVDSGNYASGAPKDQPHYYGNFSGPGSANGAGSGVTTPLSTGSRRGGRGGGAVSHGQQQQQQQQHLYQEHPFQQQPQVFHDPGDAALGLNNGAVGSSHAHQHQHQHHHLASRHLVQPPPTLQQQYLMQPGFNPLYSHMGPNSAVSRSSSSNAPSSAPFTPFHGQAAETPYIHVSVQPKLQQQQQQPQRKQQQQQQQQPQQQGARRKSGPTTPRARSPRRSPRQSASRPQTNSPQRSVGHHSRTESHGRRSPGAASLGSRGGARQSPGSGSLRGGKKLTGKKGKAGSLLRLRDAQDDMLRADRTKPITGFVNVKCKMEGFRYATSLSLRKHLPVGTKVVVEGDRGDMVGEVLSHISLPQMIEDCERLEAIQPRIEKNLAMRAVAGGEETSQPIRAAVAAGGSCNSSLLLDDCEDSLTSGPPGGPSALQQDGTQVFNPISAGSFERDGSASLTYSSASKRANGPSHADEEFEGGAPLTGAPAARKELSPQEIQEKLRSVVFAYKDWPWVVKVATDADLEELCEQRELETKTFVTASNIVKHYIQRSREQKMLKEAADSPSNAADNGGGGGDGEPPKQKPNSKKGRKQSESDSEEEGLEEGPDDGENGEPGGIHLVDVEYQLNRQKLTLYVARPSPEVFVDFRRMQRKLYRAFRCRIWMAYMDEIADDNDAPAQVQQLTEIQRQKQLQQKSAREAGREHKEGEQQPMEEAPAAAVDALTVSASPEVAAA